MPKPAVWNDDPECGHDVTCAFQTHYCTYIRVPRLLTLQGAGSPDQLWLVTLYQWFELWFKVLLTDLQAAIRQDGTTHEPVKLLQRGIELFQLFQQAVDLAESVAVRDLGVKLKISPALPADPRLYSDQFSVILQLAPAVADFPSKTFQGLASAVEEYQAGLDSFATRFQKLFASTLEPAPRPAPSYAEWLRLAKLLALQNGVKAGWAAAGEMPRALWEPESITPDELMFISVHQCFEVWFNLMLEQIDGAIAALESDEIAAAAALLRRLVRVQHLLVSQIEIPATMQPLDFLCFRSQEREEAGCVHATGLSPASGTESYQFREIEIASGLKDNPTFRNYLRGTDKLPIRLLTPRQAERLEQLTLKEAFDRAVARRGLDDLEQLYTASDEPNPNADLAIVADLLIQYDEFFRMWRVSHVSMVEKMIGAKSGTGFLGPEYLAETAGIRIQEHNRVFEERQVRPRFFEELWEVRTRLGEKGHHTQGKEEGHTVERPR